MVVKLLLLLLLDEAFAAAVAGAAGELSIGQFSCGNPQPGNPASGWDEWSSSGPSHFHTFPSCRSTRVERGCAARYFSSPRPPPGSRDASSLMFHTGRVVSVSVQGTPE